ncbi:brachyurin-like [Lucilia cuprina]|uniref:brachyurin-like n=1 Tax=Lucilia cuprina TaxID=7375 RepID=UPI001F054051|nr:brachyurin-like [Lucilia cuprina]
MTTAATIEQNAPIVGGSRAILGQFPHHVLLRRDSQDQLLCGGSIISDTWVLTAAHCVYNRTFVHMEFGTIDLYVDGVVMNSSTFFIHPKYKPSIVMDDVALIKLPTPLKFNKNINVIPLVPSKDAKNDFVGKFGSVTGFGWPTDRAKRYSERLLWGTVQVISNKECAKKLKERAIEASSMCAVPYMGTNMSPCRGDSGGALIWKNDEKRFVQIGIISSTKKNHCSEYPVAYARITSFLNYIRNITGLRFN